MRSWMNDLVVTLSALVVAGGFGYLYYRDVNQQFAAGNQKPIGTLVYEQNNTERRFNNREVWQQVGDNTPLYNLDSVRTARGSEAVIRLNGGTKIVMQPNSLITLDWSSKAKAVDFLSGSITAVHTGGAAAPGAPAAGSAGAASAAAPPGAVVIRSGRSQVALSNATVNVSASGSNKLAVTVSGGNASLISGGSVQTISASQVASVDTANGSARISTAQLIPVEPLANAIYVTEGGGVQVPFAWKSDLRSSAYALEVATSPTFPPTTETTQSKGTSQAVTIPPGTHYWRVVAAGRSTQPEQLTVLSDSPVAPLAPASRAVYTYDTSPPLVLFSWSPSQVASGYELQIATDRQFANVVEQTQSATNAIAVGTLTSGTYYWRVKPLYDFAVSSNVGVSQVRSFRVVRSTVLAAARLTSPKASALLNAITVQSSGILFNWHSNNDIAQWDVAVSRTLGMSKIVAKTTTPDNFFLMRTPLDPGMYYWQVRGYTSNGAAAPPSKVRSFKVSLENAKITLVSPRMNWNYDQATVASVPVVWKSTVKGNFEVDLSTQPDYSNVFARIETTFDNANFGSLLAGTYYWRVRLLARDGSTLLSSRNGTFTVLPSLLEPLPISPAGGAVLSLVNPKSINFTWDGDPRSRFYDFTLYRLLPGGVRREIGKATDLTTNQYSFKNFAPLSLGSYTWIVAAHNPAGYDTSPQSSLPVSSNFSIARLRIVDAAVLESPADGSTLNGVRALDHGVRFTWITPDSLGTASVELSADPTFTNVLDQLPAGAGAASAHIVQLLPGTYYWRVRARTHDGITAPPSAVHVFIVAALPPLAQPAGLSPAPSATVNMWNKPSLELSWNPVPDASGYTISLVDAQTGAPVFSDINLTGTSYKYTALQNLNVGPFKWRIEAYQLDRSGQVVRTSPPLGIDFNITLGNKIGTPNVKAPSRVFVH